MDNKIYDVNLGILNKNFMSIEQALNTQQKINDVLKNEITVNRRGINKNASTLMFATICYTTCVYILAKRMERLQMKVKDMSRSIDGMIDVVEDLDIRTMTCDGCKEENLDGEK